MSSGSAPKGAPGSGAAARGHRPWRDQRWTALALIPLCVWFVASLVAMTGASHGAMTEWIGSPLVAGALILLILATFYHAALGLAEVVEDYLHHRGTKTAVLFLIKIVTAGLCLIGVLAVLVILL